MALTEYDKQHLDEKQQAKIIAATEAYDKAKAAGDKEGMAKAAQQAQTVRNVAGYTSDSYGNYSGTYSPTTTSGGSSGGGSKYTPSTYKYSIGSDAGKQIAQDMGIGQSYTASDGSVWTKNNDGTITVNHKGVVTNNAYTPTDYGILGQQQMEAGVGWRDVEKTYNARHNKASKTDGLGQYANDDLQQAMWDYIQEAKQKEEEQARQKQEAAEKAAEKSDEEDNTENDPTPTEPEEPTDEPAEPSEETTADETEAGEDKPETKAEQSAPKSGEQTDENPDNPNPGDYLVEEEHEMSFGVSESTDEELEIMRRFMPKAEE